MKKLFRVILLFLACSSAYLAEAQSVTTGTISFTLDDVTEIFMPPDLRLNVSFNDDNNDNILEAEESGSVRVSIVNKGGDADAVKVTMTPLSYNNDITLVQKEFTTRIDKNQSRIIDFKMRAGLGVPTGNTKFKITVTEEKGGYDIIATLELSTFAYQKPELTINGVELTDSGRDLRAFNGNPDNKLQNGDVARADVMIQNVGEGEAKNVSYYIVSRDPNINFITNSGYASVLSGKLGNMLVGQTQHISFRLSPNARYVNKGTYIPVFLSVKEERGMGNIVSRQIPIPFDAVAVKPAVVKVEANREKLMASLGTKVYSDDERVMTKSDFKDIMVVPFGTPLYSDAVAVVIGSEEYNDKTIPMAPYAKRDATVLAEYFKKALGVRNIHLMTNEQVTSMALKKMFDPEKGMLKRSVITGETDVFVYYSGHGVPLQSADGTQDIALIPYDVDKSWIQDEGFSLNRLYTDLSSLGAKSVTVILDACFSGGSRVSDVYQSKSVAGQKLVVIKESNMKQPWLNNPSFRVFTSSSGNQTSLGNDRSQSGLFTYYVAVGLQGDADRDKNGTVTMTELVDFVTENVNKVSDGSQTPQFYGDSDFVIEKLK